MDNKQKNVEFLLEALKHDRLSHSYIFSGCDDLVVAQTIAQHVLCKQEHTACGSCSSCVKLLSHNHPDLMVIEPDGASIKNAQVEAFQEFMVIRPFESVKKIAIFKSLELMTVRAQNRLLKLLEEPPEYGLIIFMTNQIQSVLDTVISRCQVIHFDPVNDQNLDKELQEHALDFVKRLQYKDVNAILAYSAIAKNDKEQFKTLLPLISQILRDVMIFSQTQNIYLISDGFFSILDYKDYISQMADAFELKYIIDLIFKIEEVQQKIKANRNFDLTVDQLLLGCID